MKEKKLLIRLKKVGKLKKMIPLFKPFMPELPELNNILHSGKLAAGEYTKEFERLLKEFIGSNNVLAVNSFDSAYFIAINSLGLKYGDEVIASPMACLASTQPCAAMGLKVVWADVDPKTGTLDPDDVLNKITLKTRAIIHNHFCGYPGYVDEINAIGKKYNIPIIDDGIEAFGSEYKGKKIGNCGADITVFSFNPVRTLTTVEGGAVVFKDEKLFKKSILIRDCGIDRPNFRDELGEIKPDCDIALKGFSATLSNLNSYIGIKQFETLNDRIKKQRENAKKWDNVLTSGDYIPLKSHDGKPNYWVYGILADNKKDCIVRFREEGFYASGVHFKNSVYSVFGNQGDFLGVDKFFDSFVALPCGWWMEDEL